MVSLLLSPRSSSAAAAPRPNRLDLGPVEEESENLSGAPGLGRRINTRFFLSANAALLLISFGLILIPVAGMLHPDRAAEREALGAVVAILTLSAFAATGLLYSARKGDLHWLKSLRERRD